MRNQIRFFSSVNQSFRGDSAYRSSVLTWRIVDPNYMLTYLPSDFWGVALTRRGSALPAVLLRSACMCLPAVVAGMLKVPS